MNLKPRQMIRANTIFKFLKTQTRNFLDEHKITSCKKCDGLGIMNKGYSWNGTEFCDECEGIGFVGLLIEGGIQVSDSLYLCRKCAGLGCRYCNEKGVVDWVSHAMG